MLNINFTKTININIYIIPIIIWEYFLCIHHYIVRYKCRDKYSAFSIK